MIDDNRIYVIARYKEDLSWVENLKGNILIFNKSEFFDYKFPRQDLENYGRETQTFVNFIVRYYNLLKDYDSVVFLQGNPFEHCTDVLDKISKVDPKSFEFLSDKKATTTFPKRHYYSMHLSTMCRLFNMEYDWTLEEFIESENDSRASLESLRHFEHCIALCQILKINTQNLQFDWASGCQYQVPVEKILNKPLEWWVTIHHIHTYFSKIRKVDFFSYVLETVWPLLINHVPNSYE